MEINEIRIDYDFRGMAVALGRSGKIDPRIQLAFEHAIQGCFDTAAAGFEATLIDGSEDRFTAYFHAGICRLLNREPVKASRHFDAADALRSNRYWVRIYSGLARFYLGLKDEALIQWFKAQQIDQTDLVKHLLAKYLTKEHHPERMALYPLCRGRGIDVGCGNRKTHPRAIGVDITPRGEFGASGSVKGRRSESDITASGDALTMFADGELDYVIQRHNLEHYQDPIKAIEEWKRVLKPGGVLGMVVPDDEGYDSIHSDPDHKHVFTQESITRLIRLIGDLDIIYINPLLYRWSFVCILQKMMNYPTGSQPDRFDYAQSRKQLKIEQLQQQADIYQSKQQPDLADQCRLAIQLLN